MSLLMDMSGYLRCYGSATLEELARHFQTADDTIETAADVLRQKGRVARRRVLPQCTSGECGSGGCGPNGCGSSGAHAGGRRPVTVYVWLDRAAKK